jgi:hypothetical protein
MPYKNPEDKKKYNRTYQDNNRPSINKAHREWKRRNPVSTSEQQKRWRLNNPKSALILTLRGRCKRSGTPFNLTVDDIEFPDICPVLGVKIDRLTKETSHSLDRIDPKLGYIRGNVCMISQRANRLKQDATKEELEKIIAYIDNCNKNTPTL